METYLCGRQHVVNETNPRFFAFHRFVTFTLLLSQGRRSSILRSRKAVWGE